MGRETKAIKENPRLNLKAAMRRLADQLILVIRQRQLPTIQLACRASLTKREVIRESKVWSIAVNGFLYPSLSSRGFKEERFQIFIFYS